MIPPAEVQLMVARIGTCAGDCKNDTDWYSAKLILKNIDTFATAKAAVCVHVKDAFLSSIGVFVKGLATVSETSIVDVSHMMTPSAQLVAHGIHHVHRLRGSVIDVESYMGVANALKYYQCRDQMRLRLQILTAKNSLQEMVKFKRGDVVVHRKQQQLLDILLAPMVLPPNTNLEVIKKKGRA